MKKITLFVLSLFLMFSIYSQSSIEKTLNEQEKLIGDIRTEFKSMSDTIENLKYINDVQSSDNKLLKNYIEVCNSKIANMEINIESMKKALLSNKEDTSVILEELGEMQSKLDEYKEYVDLCEKRVNTLIKVSNISIPIVVVGGACVGVGTYMLCNNNPNGKYFLICGGVSFIGVELVLNGGHFIFKSW